MSEIDEWLRRKHDPACRKWMPHVNLLYPFVEPELINQFANDFRDMRLLNGDEIPKKLDVEFKGVSSFKHKSTSTMFLGIGGDNVPLRKLRTLAENVAERIVQGAANGHHDREWTPHLTVAKLKTREMDIEAFKVKVGQEFIVKKGKWDFSTSTLAVLQKIGTRMEVVETITLALPGACPSRTRKTMQFCSALTRQIFYGSPDFRITPVGSAVMTRGRGCSSLTDVDIVLSPPATFASITPGEFASAAKDLMNTTAKNDCNIRVVGDAQCPVIALDLARSHHLLPVDIMFGNTSFAMQAIADTEALVSIVNGLVAHSVMTREVYIGALLEIKGWAKAKMLTQRGYTLFAGVSWPILLIAAGQMANERNLKTFTDIQSLLVHFFEVYSTFNFREHAVSCKGAIPRGHFASLHCDGSTNVGSVIVTPASQVNANRGVSFAVTAAVQSEMKAALAALRSDLSRWRWYSHQPLEPLEKIYESIVVVCVAVPDESYVQVVEGWLRGRFAHFANQELGERGIAVRPAAVLEVYPNSDKKGFTCLLVSGICEEWSTAHLPMRRALVAHAANTLNDRFLRWGDRPHSSTLRVVLASKKMASKKAEIALLHEPEKFALEW